MTMNSYAYYRLAKEREREAIREAERRRQQKAIMIRRESQLTSVGLAARLRRLTRWLFPSRVGGDRLQRSSMASDPAR